MFTNFSYRDDLIFINEIYNSERKDKEMIVAEETKKYKSVEPTFKESPFRIIYPKITVAGSFVSFDFKVDFQDKTNKTKFVFNRFTIIDKFSRKASVEPEDQNNLFGGSKCLAMVDGSLVYKGSFKIVVSFITMDGISIDVAYAYEGKNPVRLTSVSIADMTAEDKKEFASIFNANVEKLSNIGELTTGNTISEPEYHDFDDYITAISQELFFLKNNGGKKYKATDGHLLTPNSNEYCYSFELETELYLSDDAPVAVTKGLETVYGVVVVCDGFQIIVSLESDIGDTVSSAEIGVEPWKLLEKLRDGIKTITPSNRIAWKLFHEGPFLADKVSDISKIKRGQEEAIKHAIENDITVIWGPPGTGKTYTMAKMAECFVSEGKSILIVSHSNISVDNVVKQISNQFSQNHLAPILPEGKVLRYGFVRDEELSQSENCVAFNFALNNHPVYKKEYIALSEESRKLKVELEFKHDTQKAEKRKELEKQLKMIRAKLKEETKLYVAKAQVVATTVSKIYMDKLFDGKKYDVVMFDEVSMAYVPQLLYAAKCAKEKFICVGDFRQLSPIVQSEKAKELLQKDIFSILNIGGQGDIRNHPWLVMLNEQRRMHPSISKFSNQRIYKGLLKDHPSMFGKWDFVTEKDPLSDEAMNLIDVFGTYCAASKNADNSRFNIMSALLSFAVALKSEKAQYNLAFKEEEKTGIITPYAAQTRLIRALIQDYRENGKTAISCATVHQFQGSERNVIIFDAVESYPFTKPGWLVSKNENNSVLRLINVAITRARCKFITVANTRFWANKFSETQNVYYKLLEHIKANDNVIDIKNDTLIKLIKELDFGKNINVLFGEEDAWVQLLKDVEAAKEQIVITLPSDKLNYMYANKFIEKLHEHAHDKTHITGKAKAIERLDTDWKNLLYGSKDAVFPLIVIDKKIIWYGFPLSELAFEDKNSKFIAVKNPIFRIRGKHTNEMIYSLCNLDYRIDEKGFKIKLQEKANSTAGKGLAAYVHNHEICPKCKKPMNLYRSHNGKFMLKCSSCGEIGLLSVDTVNMYLDKVNGKCTVCGKDMYAGVGPFGLYVRCSNNHYTKLSEI